MKIPSCRLFLLGMFAACIAFDGCDPGTESLKRPNIVVILADDIGYGDLSAYGATTIHTPNVERLAASGIRFVNAHASAATSTPSHYSLLTGQYAFRRKDTGIARGNAYMIIEPDQYTLPAMLQEAGYTTGVVGKWHLGLGDENGQDWNGYMTPGPKQIGFDYSYIMAATGDRTPCIYLENQQIVRPDPSDPVEVSYTTPFPGEPLGRTHPELLTKLKPSHGHDMAIVNGISRIGYMRGGKSALWVDENIADSITYKAVAFIENHKDCPFFLYFGTNDIHVPRYPHPRFVGKSGMGLRGDAILEFDWSVGQILDVLERNNLTDNTLIILTSDNGPVVDDGYRDQAVELLGDHRPWGALRGGKYSAFDAGTRVPFIVSWPAGSLAQGEDSPALVSQVDMLATLAALTGQRLPKKSAPDSFNQLKAWMGEDMEGRKYVVKQSNTLSVINGEWKYIEPAKGAAYWPLTNTETGISQEPQLYHLSQDIGERNNVASDDPDKVEELQKLIDWVKDNARTR